MTSRPAPLPSRLHRAIVALPAGLCSDHRALQERIVFFETGAPYPCATLEMLLSELWHVEAIGWGERGFIYVSSAHDRLHGGESFAEPEDGDLRLFDTGIGSELCGVGASRIHYARRADVDLFVTPRLAVRLNAALDRIEALYAAEPARRAAVDQEAA
jgi:hypothetical protein